MKLKYIGKVTIVNDLFTVRSGDVIVVPDNFEYNENLFDKLGQPEKEFESVKSKLEVDAQEEPEKEIEEEIVEEEEDSESYDEEAMKFKYWRATKKRLRDFLDARDVEYSDEKTRNELLTIAKVYCNKVKEEVGG